MPAWYAALKVILAIGEADLVFQGEYLPTYLERYTRINEKTTILDSKELCDLFRWATLARLGKDNVSINLANCEPEKWLLYSLSILIPRYLEIETNIQDGLKLMKQRSFHPAHRALYFIHHFMESGTWPKSLLCDPIFPIWESAIQIIEQDKTPAISDLVRLVAIWENTLQPLPI